MDGHRAASGRRTEPRLQAGSPSPPREDQAPKGGLIEDSRSRPADREWRRDVPQVSRRETCKGLSEGRLVRESRCVPRDFVAVNGLVRVMELLHAADVAELLGIPVATLANWRASGKGPPYLQVGRHVRYRTVDVETWIAGRVRDPEAVVPRR